MISFIIPVYNSEKTIKRCIDSILNQTNDNYEIIVVDDCSSDASLEILEGYGENICLLIHDENKGVSAARNSALKEAKGNYIVFVDSDDFVEKHFVEKIMNVSAEVDLFIWKSATVLNNEYRFEETFNNNENSFIISHDSFGMSEGPDVGAYLHAKAFKQSIIRNNGLIFNEKMSMGEDSLFIKEYLCCMKNGFYQSDDIVYFYTKNNENSLSKKYYDNLEYCYSKIYDALEKLQTKYPGYTIPYGRKKLIATMVIQNLYADNCKLNLRQRLKIIKKYMNDSETREEMYMGQIAGMDKIRKILFKIKSPFLLDSVYRVGKIFLNNKK